MASRKKADPAALRTVGLFSGLTPIEEAERLAAEESEDAYEGEPRFAGDMIPTAEKAAVEWLKDETVDRGEQLRVAKGKKSVVLMVIRGDAPAHPYSTINLRLSRRLWEQLKNIVRQDKGDSPPSVSPPLDLPFPES